MKIGDRVYFINKEDDFGDGYGRIVGTKRKTYTIRAIPWKLPNGIEVTLLQDGLPVYSFGSRLFGGNIPTQVRTSLLSLVVKAPASTRGNTKNEKH